MPRPVFLSRTGFSGAQPRATSKPRSKANRSVLLTLLGDLLVWSGLVHRRLKLEDLDSAYAQLLKKRRAYTHPSSKGARAVERDLKAHMTATLQRGRGV